MTQGSANRNVPTPVKYSDSANIDAFGRLRVSDHHNLFSAQLTYNLQPIVFEQITTGTGATVTHDATNRQALMTFSATPTGGASYMQSYQFSRYEPGKSQFIFISFNFKEGVSNVIKFAGYSDGQNGIELQLVDGVPEAVLYSGTSLGDQTVTQANWNLDTLDGNGPSGITFDVTAIQILVIDLQALYSGRVRMGFDIDGVLVYFHEFNHANSSTSPYIQSANLPIRCGMTCTGTVSTTMNYICSSVSSEGGNPRIDGQAFTTDASITAASGARTYIMSLRPKTTFNSIVNRYRFALTEINILVTGTKPVFWELCIGQAVTTPSYADVNATYSSTQVDTAGTLSGSPAIVIASGYVPAGKQTKGTLDSDIFSNYPITLDAAGAVRANGTLTMLATGIGGTSAMRCSLGFEEER